MCVEIRNKKILKMVFFKNVYFNKWTFLIISALEYDFQILELHFHIEYQKFLKPDFYKIIYK